MRIIKSMEEKYLVPALELVDAVFTASECAENGKLVRSLVEAPWVRPETGMEKISRTELITVMTPM